MKSKNPLVSIIIPVYNVEKYLEQCLESVLNQRYINIEVITIDDGSTDSSPHILEEYKKRFLNLKVYLQQKNQGQGVARNIGIEKAKGDYILFVDSDDYIELDTVEYLVDKILEKQVDFIRFNATSFSSEGEVIKEDEYKFSHYLKEEKVYKGRMFKDVYLSFMPSPVLYMFKKQLLTDHNISFPAEIIHEDEVFSTLLFLYATSCVYVDKNFYRRRYRVGSTMTQKTKKQINRSFESYLKILEVYQELLTNQSLSSAQIFFLKYRINSIYYPLRKQAKNDKQKAKIENISEDKLFYTANYKNWIRLLKAYLQFKNKF